MYISHEFEKKARALITSLSTDKSTSVTKLLTKSPVFVVWIQISFLWSEANMSGMEFAENLQLSFM